MAQQQIEACNACLGTAMTSDARSVCQGYSILVDEALSGAWHADCATRHIFQIGRAAHTAHLPMQLPERQPVRHIASAGLVTTLKSAYSMLQSVGMFRYPVPLT